MNRYQQGKIYTIRSHQTDKFYIGSTCLSLAKRLGKHQSNFRSFNNGQYHNVSSFEIVKLNDCYIELLEDCKCDSKDQLTKREGELIRLHKDNCLNVRIEGRTQKEYNKDNKESIFLQKQDYRTANKEAIARHKKVYFETNKEQILAPIICECGSSYNRKSKSKHLTTTKHQEFITNI